MVRAKGTLQNTKVQAKIEEGPVAGTGRKLRLARDTTSGLGNLGTTSDWYFRVARPRRNETRRDETRRPN